MQMDGMTVLAGVGAIVLQGLSLWFIYRVWKKLRTPRTPRAGAVPLAIKGGVVPVVATFTGLRGLPWVALTTNSLNPVFRIESEQLVYRVLRQRQRPFADIRRVDVREAYGTFNLIFEFRDARRTFVANVGTAARGAQALSLLPQGVPLSERAREALLPAVAMRA
ncbi:hypothetical protein [Variovorax sp. Root473]|uniref:hypothetical protein n=1 Tax=Variovorax sp. Root473 TaxID=1736541 RepID=UPI0007006ADD|nr:hypothetical protein [Variovorax sp. Root473]KQX87319.1 hypothetical protein ASD34_13565 [Variovorax sp. Root473]